MSATDAPDGAPRFPAKHSPMAAPEPPKSIQGHKFAQRKGASTTPASFVKKVGG